VPPLPPVTTSSATAATKHANSHENNPSLPEEVRDAIAAEKKHDVMSKIRVVAKVQFILRLYKNMQQIISSFDLAPCKFTFDGVNFHGLVTSMIAVKYKISLPDPIMVTNSRRALKYNNKGFTFTIVCGQPKAVNFINLQLEHVNKLASHKFKTANEKLFEISKDNTIRSYFAEAQLYRWFRFGGRGWYLKTKDGFVHHDSGIIAYQDPGFINDRKWMHLNELDPSGFIEYKEVPVSQGQASMPFHVDVEFPSLVSAWQCDDPCVRMFKVENAPILFNFESLEESSKSESKKVLKNLPAPCFAILKKNK
jgi:hypothetical protein